MSISSPTALATADSATAAQPFGVRSIRLPDFIIIGSPKSGTTTLYSYLQHHPDVFMSTPKELSFFCDDEVYARGFEWYATLFEAAGQQQLCGEASTTYSRWPTYENTVDRLAAALPNARFLYIVRNPVDRLYSFYAHRMREKVTSSIDEFLTVTPEAIHSGRYMSQIDQYLRRYPRERLHVLLLDDLKTDPRRELEEVRSFLGLGEFDFMAATGDVVANRGQGHFAATQSITRVIGRLKSAPGAGRLLHSIPPAIRQKLFCWLQQGSIGRLLRGRHTGQLTPLTPGLRCKLFQYFREDLDRFEVFLGRDLSHWRPSE